MRQAATAAANNIFFIDDPIPNRRPPKAKGSHSLVVVKALSGAPFSLEGILMPRNGSGVYSLPAGSTFTPNTLAQSSVVNGINNDIATDLNTPRPIVAGGTGAPDVVTARTNLGIAWEIIGAYSPSGVTTVVVTGLSAFRRLRLTGYVIPSSTASVFIQTSTDNGSSYAGGATDYTYQDLIAANTTIAAGRSSASAMAITANSVSECVFVSTIENFNVSGINAVMNTMSTILQSGVRNVDFSGAARADNTARNALRMLMGGSVAFSGNFLLEGVRG
ncbi:hypothetical protein [Rhizobium sp. NXC24]|uniref:hypothetical protein n=1 Tax=Rhizobium sp. NXC24 TaxID=2048897 RepID=UPI000CDF498A|nr:hypothetical protein [Rhizobium sp. NXC24]AVA22462.1 hypothetical protein NXC24_CH02832 [Rhizobium sp. NXC24]